MGDTEQSDDPKSGSSGASSSDASLQDKMGADDEVPGTGDSPASLPPSDPAPQVRRSSLRPAPASFRPSTRDPSQLLRPAMVIHAGDVDPEMPLWDISDPAPSHPSQPSVDEPERPEPFRLAEDYVLSEPQLIPPPAPIPAKARERVPNHRKTLSHFGAPNRTSSPDMSDDSLQVVQAESRADEPTAIQASNENYPPTSAGCHPSIADIGWAKRLTRGHIAAILAAIVLAGVVVAMMLGRTNNGTAAEAGSVAVRIENIPPSASMTAPIGPGAVEAPVAAAAASEAPEPPPSSAEEALAQPDVSASAIPSTTPSPNTTHVTLDVKPLDAKVIYLGKLQSGPPYEFDVPKGKRMAMEVVRFGFVTQKVVLDGKKPFVTIGMRRSSFATRGAMD